MKLRFREMTALLILLVLLLTGYNFLEMNKEAKNLIKLQLINDADNITLGYQKQIPVEINRLETIKAVVSNLSVEELSAYPLYNPYLKVTNASGDPYEIYVGFEDGHFISGYDWGPDSDYDPRQREWYIHAYDSDATRISSVYEDYSSGDMMITVSSPLVMEESKVGVIAMDIRLTDLTNYLNELNLKDGEYAYVIDSEGVVLAHTMRSQTIGKSIASYISSEGLAQIKKAIYKETELVSYAFGDDKILAVIREIDEVNWFIGVAINEDQIKLKTVNLSPNVMFLNIIMFVFIMLIVLVLYKYEKKLNEANQLLHLKSVTDGLTQIENRGSFDKTFEVFWNKAIHEKKEVGLIIFDVDNFKKYNDFYGHVKGDQVLIDITTCVKALLEPSDCFARYGGEEFVIVRYDTSFQEMYELAQTTVKVVHDAEIEHRQSEHAYVTISAGVHTLQPTPEKTMSNAVYEADIALYSAKNSGKNNVQFVSK